MRGTQCGDWVTLFLSLKTEKNCDGLGRPSRIDENIILNTPEMTLSHLGICNILEKRVRRSLVSDALGKRKIPNHPAALRRPRFSFFIFNCQRTETLKAFRRTGFKSAKANRLPVQGRFSLTRRLSGVSDFSSRVSLEASTASSVGGL